jgi:hypothetical protein
VGKIRRVPIQRKSFAMKIRGVKPKNRRKAFEVRTRSKTFYYPYSRLDLQPELGNKVADAYVDKDLGGEGFTHILESGDEGTVHVEQVLEYNEDPTYLRDLLLYKLTLEARKRVDSSPLSKREIIQRLGTSASQFYRLLDQTNYRKFIGQLLSLLHILDCDVEVVVRNRRTA